MRLRKLGDCFCGSPLEFSRPEVRPTSAFENIDSESENKNGYPTDPFVFLPFHEHLALVFLSLLLKLTTVGKI